MLEFCMYCLDLNVVSRKDTVHYKFFIGNNERQLDTFEPRDYTNKVRATKSNEYLKEHSDLLAKRRFNTSSVSLFLPVLCHTLKIAYALTGCKRR